MPWQLIKNAMSSLKNHILFFQVILSLPLALLFIAYSYVDQDLTWSRALWIVMVWSGVGAAIAFFGWHTIILPMRRRRGR